MAEEDQFTVGGNDARKCSRCGARYELALVTLRYSQHEPGGRVLLYCPQCRTDFSNHIGVCIPLDDVTDDVFLELYRTGNAESDPSIAVRMVYGEDRPELVRAAGLLLPPDETRGGNI